jgi:hypothetical protein
MDEKLKKLWFVVRFLSLVGGGIGIFLTLILNLLQRRAKSALALSAH